MHINPEKITNKLSCACGSNYCGPAVNGTHQCDNCWAKQFGIKADDNESRKLLERKVREEAAKLFDGKVPVFEVKNFKTCRAGMENDASSFTLYIDGKKAAEVSDEGNGGPLSYDFYDDKVAQRVARYVATLPDREVKWDSNFKLVVTVELFLGELLEKAANAKELEKVKKRVLKQLATQTLISLKGDRTNTYHIYKMAFSPSAKEFLVKKHGDKLEKIWNELDAAGLEKACEGLFG